jgi:hypothetical protein
MNTAITFQILGSISMAIGILTVVGKILIVKPLKDYIEEQTHSIQPHANGGKSLPDIAKNVIEIKSNLENLSHQVDRVETRLDTHIEQHVKGEA